MTGQQDTWHCRSTYPTVFAKSLGYSQLPQRPKIALFSAPDGRAKLLLLLAFASIRRTSLVAPPAASPPPRRHSGGGGRRPANACVHHSLNRFHSNQLRSRCIIIDQLSHLRLRLFCFVLFCFVLFRLVLICLVLFCFRLGISRALELSREVPKTLGL